MDSLVEGIVGDKRAAVVDSSMVAVVEGNTAAEREEEIRRLDLRCKVKVEGPDSSPIGRDDNKRHIRRNRNYLRSTHNQT